MTTLAQADAEDATLGNETLRDIARELKALFSPGRPLCNPGASAQCQSDQGGTPFFPSPRGEAELVLSLPKDAAVPAGNR